jgi:hypothetical protein
MNSSPDLSAALGTVTNVAYQVQKNADGSGSVSLVLQETYNPNFATFENLALTSDHSARLAKAMGQIGARWSRILHPYSVSLSTTYDYPATLGPQPTATSNFPLGTYTGSYSIVVNVGNVHGVHGETTTVNSIGTMTVTISSYNSLDNLASGTITLSDFAGHVLTDSIQGTIGAGSGNPFDLRHQGGLDSLSLNIAGTFSGTTMFVSLLQAEHSGESTSNNGVFELTPS